jgi:hypothetical protein
MAHINLDYELATMIKSVQNQTGASHCNVCATRPDGTIKANGVGHFIMDELVHNRSADHLRRMGEERHLLPHVIANARAPGSVYSRFVPRLTTTHRCAVCSLTPAGYPRLRHHEMDTATVAAHVGGTPHGDRVNDGRFLAFLQRGQPW